jgi:hypothetical protein
VGRLSGRRSVHLERSGTDRSCAELDMYPTQLMPHHTHTHTRTQPYASRRAVISWPVRQDTKAR